MNTKGIRTGSRRPFWLSAPMITMLLVAIALAWAAESPTRPASADHVTQPDAENVYTMHWEQEQLWQWLRLRQRQAWMK
jgi:hypothetical protein